MTEILPPSGRQERLQGRVIRVFGEFGFIASDGSPDQDVYFKVAWFRGVRPLEESDEVTFETKRYGDKLTAYGLERVGGDGTSTGSNTAFADRGLPATDRLLDWAYLGNLPTVTADLSSLALPERWDFRNVAADPDRPRPILYSYLLNTFGRLVLEEKIVLSADNNLAAFNTGLVDARYEKIFALFSPQQSSRMAWRFSGFCIAGEGHHGQNLVRHFNPLPSPPHYFDEPADLLYDTRVGAPEMDWHHVVIDRIERYPAPFLEDHWPSNFEVRETTAMDGWDARTAYWTALGIAIERNVRTYRSIMNRVRDAVDVAIKRTGWNFKTAVPQYYPKVRRLQLLLPICLVSDETPDMALAVEKTPSGRYLGHTILPLDWAYKNARLVCRPDSDWLAAEEIDERPDGAEATA